MSQAFEQERRARVRLEGLLSGEAEALAGRGSAELQALWERLGVARERVSAAVVSARVDEEVTARVASKVAERVRTATDSRSGGRGASVIRPCCDLSCLADNSRDPRRSIL